MKIENDTEPKEIIRKENMNCKLKGYEFWSTALKKARYIMAPMVDQSELCWRLLGRKYATELCYTPMYHAKLFSDEKSDKYRKEMFDAIEGTLDRPLVVQFCANDPDHFLKAAKLVEDKCDAVDLNLGCPQHIAKRGKYGSFLQDEWELIEKMVKNLHENLKVPVTCKIRIFPNVEKTIAYAKMLEKAGCQLLTVHGRIREQKGHNTGLADWEQIKRVKEAVNIPVFANGNILYFEDVQKCIDATGVDGVMSAEALLYNPALFSGKEIPIYQIAEEYMKICEDYVHLNKIPYIRAHLFKLYKPCLSMYTDLREELAKARTFEDFVYVSNKLNERLKEAASKVDFKYEVIKDEKGIRKYPHWICQPYIRPPNVHNKLKADRLVEVSSDKIEEDQAQKDEGEASIEKPDSTTELTENERTFNEQKGKKQPRDKNARLAKLLICNNCPNVASAKCDNKHCKSCCLLAGGCGIHRKKVKIDTASAGDDSKIENEIKT